MPAFKHKIAIVKADDFGRGCSLHNWKRFLAICGAYHCVPAVGPVGYSLERSGEAATRLLQHALEDGAAELFDHSYTHIDFSAAPPQKIGEEIAASAGVLAALGGASVFGPPFNKLTPESLRHVLASGKFQVVFDHGSQAEVHDLPDGGRAVTVPKSAVISPEINTAAARPVSADLFERLIGARKLSPLVVQVHPDYWTNHCFGEFERVMRKLVALDYLFLTPLQFGEYIKAEGATSSPAALVRLDEQLTDIFDELRARAVQKDQPYKDYYYRRYRKGSLRLRNQLIEAGFDQPFSGRRPVVRGLDIGCGAGNWMAAYRSISDRHEAVGLDIDSDLLQTVTAALQQVGSAERLKLQLADATSIPHAPESFDHVFSVNALNYMPAESVLRETARVLRLGGQAFFSIQNQFFPVADALGAMRAQDPARAATRLEQLLRFLASRAGLSFTHRFWRTWSSEEFKELAIATGFNPVMQDFDLLEENPRLRQHSTFSGYLYLHSGQSQKRADTLRANCVAELTDARAKQYLKAGAHDLVCTAASAAGSQLSLGTTFRVLTWLKGEALRGQPREDQLSDVLAAARKRWGGEFAVAEAQLELSPGAMDPGALHALLEGELDPGEIRAFLRVCARQVDAKLPPEPEESYFSLLARCTALALCGEAEALAALADPLEEMSIQAVQPPR